MVVPQQIQNHAKWRCIFGPRNQGYLRGPPSKKAWLGNPGVATSNSWPMMTRADLFGLLLHPWNSARNTQGVFDFPCFHPPHLWQIAPSSPGQPISATSIHNPQIQPIQLKLFYLFWARFPPIRIIRKWTSFLQNLGPRLQCRSGCSTPCPLQIWSSRPPDFCHCQLQGIRKTKPKEITKGKITFQHFIELPSHWKILCFNMVFHHLKKWLFH